ncbi:hypothetical protein ACPX19_06100 [Winogradskyella sp. HB-48]|uniref:hypothetical protein n=1 Tax=Winogradskyella sp. HB-48 TaxID=3416808 RepID=UPI003CEB4861
MKKFLSSLILLLVITVLACSDDNTNEVVDDKALSKKSYVMDEAFKNNVGYIDSKTKEFIKITEKKLKDDWIKIHELDPKTQFGTIKLIEAQTEEGEKPYYMLNATTTDGRINISSKAYGTDMGIQVEGETCKCESSGCEFSGCEVVRMCGCSSCYSGTCKKTHTLTSSD